MRAPTFETLAREVLDSFTGAWMVPYPREGGAVEQFYDLYVPSGMGGMASLWIEGDRCTVQLMGGSGLTVCSDDVDPHEGAAQLRTEVQKVVTQPRDPWFDSPAVRAFAAEHLTREAVTARCRERGEPAPKFRDPDALTHSGYADQDEWRALRDLRRRDEKRRDAEADEFVDRERRRSRNGADQ